MSSILTILRREFMSYVLSPIGYVIAVMFYLFRGVEVSNATAQFSNARLDLDMFARHYLLTKVFQPASTVSTHSVSSRSVRQGTPSQ